MFNPFLSFTPLLVILNLLSVSLLNPRTGIATARTIRNARHAFSSHKTNSQPTAPDGTDESVYNPDATTKCRVPQPGKTITVSKPTTVASGQIFDCQLDKYQHVDTTCDLNNEKGHEDAVFLLEDGATLRNCFLGFSQESVYCYGKCTVENVHWLQICDEAIAFYQPSGDSTVTGCSFSNAGNKALQSDGSLTLTVKNTCFNDVDIAYRSCGSGSCPDTGRSVVFENIEIFGVKTLAGFNYAQGDTVDVKGFSGTEAQTMCEDKKAENIEGGIPPGCTIEK